MERGTKTITRQVWLALLVLPFAAGTTSAGPGNGNGQEKVTLCHVVPKTPHSITVADPAKVQAHLDHGDTIGGCDNEMPAPAAGVGAGSVINLCSQNGDGTGHQLIVSPVGRVSHIRISCD